MARALKIVVFLCLASLAALGQMGSYNYNGASTYSMVPQNFAACGSINCWHANLNQPGIGSQIFASNGRIFVINSAHQNYQLTDYPNFAWVGHPEWGTVYGLQSDAAGNIYALQGTGCGVAGDIIGKWNGSSFVNQSGCFHQFWIGGNGNALAIDLNGALWVGPPSAPVQYGVPESGKWFISASWIDDGAGVFMAVTSDNQIWVYTPGVGWTQPVSGTCCATTIAADLADAGSSGSFYVVGTDANVYYYNGSGFSRLPLAGAVSTTYGGLANGGSMHVWTVGPTVNGNNLYRFSDLAVRHSRTLSGTASCPSCTHTATTQAAWQSSISSGDGGVSFRGNPNSGINITSKSDLLDPFLCLETENGCSAEAINETVTCSVAGPLRVNGNPPANPTITFEWFVYEQAKNAGPNGAPYKKKNFMGGLVWYQDYNAIPWCSAATTPPDLNKPIATELAYIENPPVGWLMWAPTCFTYAPAGQRKGTWICPKAVALESFSTLDPNYACDSHN